MLSDVIEGLPCVSHTSRKLGEEVLKPELFRCVVSVRWLENEPEGFEGAGVERENSDVSV